MLPGIPFRAVCLLPGCPRPGRRHTGALWPLGMPTGYLVDARGSVIAVHRGFRTSDEQLLRAMITQALERAGV